jgi:hypothetical protein
MNLDNLEERLLRNSVSDPASGCWVWIGKRSAEGYGKLTVRVTGKPSPVNVYAHRAAVVAFQGKKLRADLHVDHICRNPSCINPEHLRLVKADTNLARRRYARAAYCSRCGRVHSVATGCRV